MAGIVGIITAMRMERAERQLARMLQAVHHHPECTPGTWTDGAAGVYVGWVTRKGSFAEGMPLRNERGDLTLVFSGEEFPEPGAAQRLRARGHELGTAGASYLVHLCEEDRGFPAGLNGRFNGLVTDRTRGTATLFNDRYGMHRLCWHQAGDAFYFAAEAKAILAVRPELRSFDTQGLGEFVSCGAVLENRTLFRDIFLLPPASAWIFRNGSLEKKNSYFHPAEWEDQEILDWDAYYRELRATFTENLPRYFSGDRPIGMSLTGGLDTRMILACRRPEPGSLPCYTFGSMFRENQDVRVARRVASVCKQTHQVLTAGQEFLSEFPHYAERTVYVTEGCVDVGRAPDLYLNEKAREIAPVRMTGNYGGEILRSIRAFKPVEPATGVFCPEFMVEVRRAAQTYAGIVEDHPVSFAAFRQGPWYLHGVLALEETQLTMRSPYLDNDFVRTVFRSPASALAGNEVCLRLIADSDRRLSGIPTDRGLARIGGKLAKTIARTSLEFLFKAEYAYDLGMPQWLARFDHAFSWFHLERLFLGRHKPFHFRIWYRDALAGYVEEVLLDPQALSRPYIESAATRRVVQDHLKGDGNYTTELHKLLTLELLHRLFLSAPAEDGRGQRAEAKVSARPVQFAGETVA